METLKFKISGIAPLLMHNGRLADPLDEFSKKIKKVSSKRSKTDADHEEMARLEWYGSLYVNSNGELVIPAKVMAGCLYSKGGAAGKMRLKAQATIGLWVKGDTILHHDGPADLDKLWEDSRFRLREKCVVGRASVMRTRPLILLPWWAEVEINYDPAILNKETVAQLINVAGDQVGLMDWRPLYGRFTSEIVS